MSDAGNARVGDHTLTSYQASKPSPSLALYSHRKPFRLLFLSPLLNTLEPSKDRLLFLEIIAEIGLLLVPVSREESDRFVEERGDVLLAIPVRAAQHHNTVLRHTLRVSVFIR